MWFYKSCLNVFCGGGGIWRGRTPLLSCPFKFHEIGGIYEVKRGPRVPFILKECRVCPYSINLYILFKISKGEP